VSTSFPFLGEPPGRSLGPADLRAAAAAFQAALQSLDDSADGVNAHVIRQLLARFIMESALRGERDPIRLCAGALDHLKALRRSSRRARPATPERAHQPAGTGESAGGRCRVSP